MVVEVRRTSPPRSAVGTAAADAVLGAAGVRVAPASSVLALLALLAAVAAVAKH